MTCIFTSIKSHEGKVVDSKNENELLSINGLCFLWQTSSYIKLSKNLEKT